VTPKPSNLSLRPGNTSVNKVDMQHKLGIYLEDLQWSEFVIDGHHIVSMVVFVTPELARQWLRRNHSEGAKKNRKLSIPKTRQWLKLMREGMWDVSHQNTVVFDADGDLLDCQHRLSAIEMFGQGMWFRVEYGWPRASFASIDGGAKRSADQLMPGKYAQLLASGARVVVAVTGQVERSQRKDMVTAKGDTKQTLAWAAQWPELDWHKERVFRVYTSVRISPSLHLAVLAQAERTEHRHMIDAWLDALENGIGLEADDPRLHLRNRWMKSYQTLNQGSREVSYSMIVKAWNMYVQGRPMKTLKVSWNEIPLKVIGFTPASAVRSADEDEAK